MRVNELGQFVDTEHECGKQKIEKRNCQINRVSSNRYNCLTICILFVLFTMVQLSASGVGDVGIKMDLHVDLGDDRTICSSELIRPDISGDCSVNSGQWLLLRGAGSLSQSTGLSTRYIPSSPLETGDTITLVFVADNIIGGCLTQSDTVNLKIINTHFNCLSEVNFSCGDSIVLNDVLTTDVSKSESYFKLRIEDFQANEISNPLPNGFIGEFKISVTSLCTNVTCESIGIVSDKQSCSISNTLDTTLWCIDPFLKIDPTSLYYSEELGLRPYAIENCSRNVLDVTYEGVWENKFPCGDTLKQIIHGWRSETKDGTFCTGYDTINVIRLPNLVDFIHVPDQDSVFCEYDTLFQYAFTVDYYKWKEIVAVHSEGTSIRYPLSHDLYKDLDDTYDEWNAISDPRLKDSVRQIIEDIAIVRKDLGLIYRDYNLFEIRNNIDGLFPIVTVGSDQYREYEVNLGDKILTNGGVYLDVDEKWFYKKYTEGFWIDICLPEVIGAESNIICDKWGGNNSCANLEVILPNRPNQATECQRYCLMDLISDHDCLDISLLEEEEHGSDCPKLIKRSIQIKQYCFAEGAVVLDSINCDLMPDSSGINRVSHDGDYGLYIDIEQWITYIDTIAPTLQPEGHKALVFSTHDHDCRGDVTLPSIRVKDVCSGVKEVKGTFGIGNSWITFGDDDGDGIWEAQPGGRLSMTSGEKYSVKYELLDSCHNSMTVFRHSVELIDRVSPVVLSRDTLTVTLNSKEALIPISTIDNGSSDNCSIQRMFVRRPDWLNSCGVDACTQALSNIRTESQLNSYINSFGYFAGMQDNSIERFYASQYEWLINDGEWCDESTPNNLTDQLLQGWREDIKAYWLENCIQLSGQYGKNHIPVYQNSLGGGWGASVPVCCEDACEEVVVELLVIDQNCNYTKGWTILEVRDQGTVNVANEFEEVVVGCSSYQKYYADLIVDAESGNERALDSLDLLFGALKKGWENEDGKLGDYSGKEIDLNHKYLTSICQIEPVEKRVKEILHDGTVIWNTVIEARSAIKEVEREIELGGVYLQCGARCNRSVWVEINSCGIGKIIRRWDVYGDCSEAQHQDLPLVLEQIIWVTSDCALNESSIQVPNDTVICAPFEYSLDGNAKVDAGRVVYTLPDTQCRSISYHYSDEIRTPIEQSYLRKIERTWKVSDWCSQEKVEVVQNIELDTRCDTSKVIEGFIRRRDGISAISGVKVTEIDDTGHTFSDESGYYRLENASRISLSRNTNPTEGVNIRDLLFLRRYQLDMVDMDWAESTAADVNADGRVNQLDFSLIRDMLLGRINAFPNNSSWNFYTVESHEKVYERINGFGKEQIDFIAIKTGDIDERAISIGRSSRYSTFKVLDQKLNTGDVVELKLSSSEPLEAYQLPLRFNSDLIEVLEVNGEKPSTIQSNIASLEQIYIIGFSNLLTIKIKAKAELLLHDALFVDKNFSKTHFSSLGILTNGEKDVNLGIEFINPNFKLYQNVPNPFSIETIIRFDLPESTSAKLKIFDLTGRLLYSVEDDYEAGENQIRIESGQLAYRQVSGTLIYQLETDSHLSTKSMIIIQ